MSFSRDKGGAGVELKAENTRRATGSSGLRYASCYAKATCHYFFAIAILFSVVS